MVVIWHEDLNDKQIELTQNGRFLEFSKRNSPLVYKYSMRDHHFYCYTRATDEIRSRHRGEINRWFKAQLVTEDDALAAMFKYALMLSENDTKISNIMSQFGTNQMATYEKWVRIGTKIRLSQLGWGSRRITEEIQYDPSILPAIIRQFVITKTWRIQELNQFSQIINDLYIEGSDKENHILSEVFKEISEHPEYIQDFVVIKDGESTNYLINHTALRKLVEVIQQYNLEVKRLMIYIHYLNNVEYVNFENLLDKYPQYLEKELEKQGRRNKMYKFPRFFHTEYNKRIELINRKNELANYNPTDVEYEFAYLEYEDEDFKIILPRSPEDVEEEGRQQGHCVAWRFMEAIAAGNTCVVFMRRTAEPDKSLITIEIVNNRIRQACIHNNESIPNSYRPWIRRWASLKGVEITSNSWTTHLDVIQNRR